MNQVVKHNKALYELDTKQEGFGWIDANNESHSIYSFVRYAKDPNDFVVVILNLTPLVHHDFRLGVPASGKYLEVINSDKAVYGGSNMFNGEAMFTEDVEWDGQKQSLQMVLSPLSVTIIKMGD